MSAEFLLNGAPTPLQVPALLAVLQAAGIDSTRRGMAVALNRRVVPRRDWPTTEVAAGDELEIVTPLSGG
jgi:sulfur carrier protein